MVPEYLYDTLVRPAAVETATLTWSVPLPVLSIVKSCWLPELGLAGDTEAGETTSTPAAKPTVTLTLAVAFAYVLPLASV